jgi:hypothetical protein
MKSLGLHKYFSYLTHLIIIIDIMHKKTADKGWSPMKLGVKCAFKERNNWLFIGFEHVSRRLAKAHLNLQFYDDILD